MTLYSVIYEQAGDGSWSARAADLPVFSVGGTRAEAETGIKAAIRLHLDELARAGETPPAAPSQVGTVSV